MGCEKSSLIHNTFASLQIHHQSNSPNPLEDGHSASPLKHLPAELSGREIMLISNAIQKHILFYKLNQDQRMKLISSMQRFAVEQAEYIFKENEEPDYAYIISTGTVRIELTKERREIKKILKEGSIFGDLALINVSKRSASAYAVTDCTLIALSKDIFHKKMEELSKDHQHLFFNFIDSAPTFKKLTNAQKSSLATHMHEVRYQKDSVIFQLGDFANCIYLIKTGEIEVTVPNRPPVVLKKGDIFGEGSLKPRSIRSGQAKALTNAHCYVISRTKLSLCIQNEDIDYITFHCIITWSLRRTGKFSKTSNALVEKIIDSGEIVMVEDGSVLATAGQSLTKMMICLQGEVTVQDIYKTLTKESQQIFSVGCIFNQDYESPMKSPYTITKKSKGRLFTIDHKVLKTILHPIQHRVSISIQPSQPEISLKDFELIKHLQRTSYTSKYLVMDNKAKQSYVMHVFNKLEVIQYKRQRLLLNDKGLNQSIKNRFVINLERTLKDQSHVYFIYREYLNFTLDTLIKRVNFPNHQTIDFIAMTLINFLQFLHKELIIFRDLKPDNIILDKNGYPHFLSFMLAKKMSKENFKTYTIIGTPHYLAPEVQQGMGYSFPSDYWSLGVIIYQMAIGYLPFADDKEDPYEIFIATQKQKLLFPKSFTNKRMKKLIKLLLCKESWNRPDHTNIKTCGYFDEMTREKWSQLDQALTKCPQQIEKLITDFSDQLAQEALHETQGSFMAIFERQKLRYNNRCSAALDCSWDEEF